MELTEVVAGMIFNSEGKVLVITHNKCKGLKMFPVGKVNKMETLIDALKREINEETGIDVRTAIPRLTIPTWYDRVDGVKAYLETTYKVLSYSGEAFNAEPEKHSDMKWVDLKEIIDNPKEYSHSCWANAVNEYDGEDLF